MWDVRLKIKNTVDINIGSINAYLQHLSKEEKDELFVKMKDILIFYGITPKAFIDILKAGKVPDSFPLKRLSDLEGITNAMLFKLKYKRKSYKKEE